MTDLELHAEAKRRVQRSMPSLSDAQWERWLASSLRAGAAIALTLDGCVACYPRNTPQTNAGAAT